MSSVHATLEVMVDHLEQQRQRVGELLISLANLEGDDATALFELERSLGQSVKVARRAVLIVGGSR